MIVLSKKKISLVLMCLVLGVFTFMFTTAKQKTELNKTVATVTLPVSGKTVVLDARTWNTR